MCKLLEPSRLHDLQDSKLPLVSLIEFIRSKFSLLFANVNEVTGRPYTLVTCRPALQVVSYRLMAGSLIRRPGRVPGSRV